MAHLKTLQAIAVLGFFANNVENRVDQLGAFRVVTFGPVVAGAGLAEDEVIGPENLANGAGSDAVHGAGLEIHKNGPGNKPSTAGLVVVDVDALQLQIGVAMVAAGGVDAVLGADHFPELGADLVAALASLDVENLTHFSREVKRQRGDAFSVFESDRPMVSVEIGHGSVLIRHPSSIGWEEESEASSLSVDNKLQQANEAYSSLTALPVNIDNKGVNFRGLGIERGKKTTGQGMQQEQIKRDKAQLEKIQLLGSHDSPLCYVDLKDVLDFDVFASHLTSEEQQQLLKYLPPTDTNNVPDGLESMFASPQFEENLSSFRKLLAKGVFDLSFSGIKAEDCGMLKRLALSNLTKSKWVEQYNNLLKDVKCKSSGVVPRVPNAFASGNPTNVKRLRDGQLQHLPGEKTTMKSPKRVLKGTYEHKEGICNDGSCFSPRSLLVLPPDNSSVMLDSFQFTGESSDQDLLLDVPSNSSFPEAELLLPASSFGVQASTSSSSIYPQLVRP